VEADLSLQKYDTLEDCASKQTKTPEARTPEVNLGHPNQEDTWRQISHFGDTTLLEDCKNYALKRPEARTPEVIVVDPTGN
jgi:hypothetical protein